MTPADPGGPGDARPTEERTGEPAGQEPAGERPAGRGTGAARAVRGAFAATLTLEALSVLFVPRAIAQFGPGLTALRLGLLLGLAGALVVAAGLQRRRAGLVAGSVLQAALIATGILVGAMYVVGVLFALVWVYLLRVRRAVLGRAPAG
jgi:hypothetical protein